MIRRQLLSLVLAAVFYLGVRDGYIALWKEGCADDPTVFPYRASILPRADREKLEEGIRIENEAQLIRLLEDFLS